MAEHRKRFRALIIEHSANDIELIQNALAAEFDVETTVANTLSEVGSLLEQHQWDVILSDHNLPGWSGMEALALVRERGLNIPFILVTGTLGEEKAAEYFRHGVTDYVLKHRLEMLPVAITRVLKEKALRLEKQTAESNLRGALESYRALVEYAPYGICRSLVEEDRFISVNPAFARMLGYDAPEELLPLSISRDLYAHPGELENLIANLKPTFFGFETELKHKTGKVIKAHVSGRFATADGLPRRVCEFFVQDVTEARMANEALRQSEERYRLLFDGSPLPMWVYDLQSLRFLAVNQSAVDVYGYSEEEFGRMTIKDIRPSEDVPKLLENLTQAGLRDGAGIWRHRKKDGSIMEVDIIDHKMEFDGRPAAMVLVHDVTERRSLEAQLRQAQKMEAVGRLAGGVAHDFNNLLGVIIGYSDLVSEEVSGERSQKRIAEIKKAANRAVALTRQLLAFSRKQVLEPRIIDLNHVVTEVGGMLRRLLGEDVELVLNLSTLLAKVKADPSQIEQVIMNLAVNARDAMVDGGRLTIETTNVTLDDNYGQQRHVAFTPGDYVMLAVTDTGTGMDEATKARLFEPFFTTKELGKGTGLGLATVYGIVKQSGGYVWVYSELGKGTAFKVYLPKVRGVTDVAKPDHAAKPLATGTETILLVEDSESLRELNREMLTSLGYDVLSAENGASAIQIAESHKSVIHLVLTDVVMPGINGRELVDRLIGIRPDLKIMYMSGYTDDVIVHRAILKPGIAFLQKPFSKEELAARIREVIDTLRS